MVDFQILPERPMPRLASEPFHRWNLADGAQWAEFRRAPDGYTVRFPDLADFEISADGHSVTCSPAPGTTAATTEHLYLNQVLPLALCRQGQLVFHASAVEIAGGAIAFMAPAGHGKSTLAAAFAVSGRRFLTDDGLILKPLGDGFQVVPSHPSIRLWDDSHNHLISKPAPAAASVTYTSKSRFLAGPALNYCDEPRRLLAAYVLGDGTAQEFTVARYAQSSVVLAWLKHSFLLDIEDRALLGSHFTGLTAIAEAIPTFALDYPRCYETLPEIIDRLEDQARHLESLR